MAWRIPNGIGNSEWHWGLLTALGMPNDIDWVWVDPSDDSKDPHIQQKHKPQKPSTATNQCSRNTHTKHARIPCDHKLPNLEHSPRHGAFPPECETPHGSGNPRCHWECPTHERTTMTFECMLPFPNWVFAEFRIPELLF